MRESEKETETAHVPRKPNIRKFSVPRNARRPGICRKRRKPSLVSVSLATFFGGHPPAPENYFSKNRSGRLSNRRKPTSHRSRPRITAAESRQNQVVALAQLFLVIVKTRRNRRGGRVAVAVDVDHALLMFESHAARRGVDDAQVGLMGHQITHIRRGKSVALRDLDRLTSAIFETAALNTACPSHMIVCQLFCTVSTRSRIARNRPPSPRAAAPLNRPNGESRPERRIPLHWVPAVRRRRCHRRSGRWNGRCSPRSTTSCRRRRPRPSCTNPTR